MRDIDVFAKCSMITVMFFAVMAAHVSEAKLKTVWDVGDYVQNGLLANYDGIRNAGADKPHESTKEEWVDLVGGSTAALIKISDEAADHGEWKENGYRFEGYSYFQAANEIELGNEFTVQLVTDTELAFVDRNESGGVIHEFQNIWAYGSGFGIFLNRQHDGAIAKTNIIWKEDAYCDGNATRPSFEWEGKYINAAFDAKYSYLVQTPYWMDQKNNRLERTAPVSVGPLKYNWGGCSGKRYCSIGVVYAYRAYSRKLTDSELAWNRLVDEIRFRGADILPVTNVVVEADAFGRIGAEAAGIYMVEDAHTFTAGNVTIDGNVYKPVGYRIEEWNESEKKWQPPVSHDGASYEYVASSTSPKVRLSWIWKFIEGVERVDARHYIQDGLVANYDGIWNRGIGKQHDSTKAEWIDLVCGAAATLVSTDSAQDSGEWTESGYRFMGYSYFRTANEIELGTEFTIQLATDMYLGVIDDAHDYPNIWAQSGDFNIYLNRSGGTYIAATNLYFKEDGNSGDGNRPYFDWSGKYINAAFSDGYSYMTDTPYWISGNRYSIKHSETTPVPSSRSLWGGRTSNAYCSKGIIYAWRAYSRKLTDSELAWNRDIDEIRFHDAMPTTISNAVAVASSRAGFAGNEEGVYLLSGIHTFTADKKTDNGVTYAPKFDVESWDGNAGEWKVTASGSGGECVLREADSAVPRRIVWKWFKEGFSVIVR